MLRIGLVGIGFMGWIHYLAAKRTEAAEIVAFASRDAAKRAGDWRGIQGNFGPPGEKIDVSGMRAYDGLEALLADPDVDLVDLCLPPHQHEPAALAAFAAGKHVLVEKPMALSAESCRRMVDAADAAGRRLFVAHVLPFFPEFAFALDALRRGAYGPLLGATSMRTISDPTWLSDFWDEGRVGGPLIDLMVHDAHLVALLMGMPDRVSAVGRLRDGVVAYTQAVLRYDHAHRSAAIVGGVIGQQGRPFTHGFELQFETATLQFQSAGLADGAEVMPLKVLTADGSVVRPGLPVADPVNAFVGELEDVAACLAENRPSVALEGRLARDAIRLCEAIRESVLAGGEVELATSAA